MAKKRMVAPEIWTDDKFVSLEPLARLLFIGMWNFACDNGHLDDSALQLKMRVLPADNCDVSELLDSLLAAGIVARRDGYLKVVNLAGHQHPDLRFLVLCDHCDADSERRYSESDRRARKGDTSGARSAPTVSPKSAPRNGGVDGGVDGGGGGKQPRERGTRIPDDFKVTDDMRQWADDNGFGRMDLAAITAEFVDYWVGVSGQKGVKLDWVATWRNRVRVKAGDASTRRAPAPVSGDQWARAIVVGGDR